jgi:cell division septum initiation protein DivIVA
MECLRCGSEVPERAAFCPSCGFALTGGGSVPSAPSKNRDAVDDVLREARRAVQDLAAVTAKLSKQVASTAGAAARDPSGTARRATRRAKKEIDEALADLSETLKKL